MKDKLIFKTQSLVLDVNQVYNPLTFPLDDWERYLDVLCVDRDYQKQAIKNAIIYLFSGRYKNIENLVQENYNSNPDLRERFTSLDDYHRDIQLPNKLSGTVDLATGTGKSYVMYGIAQIALGMGFVDRVLLLCPSLTIERGLMDKFTFCNSNAALASAIPESAIWKSPNVIDASHTISPGDICIENIHAVYSKNKTSIFDSLGFHKGSTCLVLSDEVHHAYNAIDGSNEEQKAIKKWKGFLTDPTYNFRFLLGFTGTAYINSDYFNDVIYRYSINSAIENNFVKTVYYTYKDEIQNEDGIKYQKMYQIHQENKLVYQNCKPLTLLVTKNIMLAKQSMHILCEFLSNKEGIPYEEVSKNKVLIVTSAKEHETNVKVHLPSIDDKANPYEWIVSVSMLTEGWDVKNVFQIVPMEERAFNSKLLIAQVLGRGLRIPNEYQNAKVTVYNHDSWSAKIKNLVNEILEYEFKLLSTAIESGDRAAYHFKLFNIEYERTETLVPTRETEVFRYEKELIKLQSQTPEFNTYTEFENFKGEIITRNFKVRKDTESVSSVVNKVFEEFRSRKYEGVALKLKDGQYTTNEIPKETIERLIRNSMAEAKIDGDELTKVNKQSILSAFATLLRKKPKSVTSIRVAKPYFEISTLARGNETTSLSNVRRDTTVFYTSDYENEIIDLKTKQAFNELKDERSIRGSFIEKIPFLFKTPVDILFTGSDPEENFVINLCKKDNATVVTSWLKSKSQNFYQIEYSLTKALSSHTKKDQKFNPDFLILIKQEIHEYIIVVEIKADGDDSDENKAKFKYGKEHFIDLNRQLKRAGINQEYVFHFLSPSNYTEFFDHLRNGKLIRNEFTSELDNLLAN
jgi:type III restriction enzyme